MPNNYSNKPVTPRGSLIYKEYFNGREIYEADSVYETKWKRLNLDRIVRSLFNSIHIYPVKIDSSKTSSRCVYKVFEPNTNRSIFLCCYHLKNSGIKKKDHTTLDRKRLQIQKNYYGLLTPGTLRNESDLYFFLGVYPSSDNYDDPVIVLLDNDGVSLNPIDSYSSLWVNFNAIKTGHNNGIYYAVNTVNGNKYVCFKKNRWPLVWSTFVQDNYSGIIGNQRINTVNLVGEEETGVDYDVDDYIPSRDAVVTRTGNSKVKRNSALRQVCFDNAGYKCECCGSSETFVDRSGQMFFEGHHLIPCNIHNQIQFTKKLDSVANLYCLCSHCHNKIHHGTVEAVESVVETLYNQREEVFKNIYHLELEKLKEIYTSEFKEDDPE